MYDAFNKAAGSGARRRENTGGLHLSPSYGVRRGFIKDPNWPPAQLPEEGNAAKRRFLRVKCGFSIRVPGGKAMKTTGDISEGGAKFTIDSAIGGNVEVLAEDFVAQAAVLEVTKAAGRYTYRVRFTDPNTAKAVFETAFKGS